MSYTILRNNPLIDAELINPDVIVNYDSDKAKFYVTFVETGTGYYVDRGDLVSDIFKYIDPIYREILSYCGDISNELWGSEKDLNVIFTARAENEVHLIWMANCDLF